MFNIFIGYDPNETIAYHVLAHSIMRQSTFPVTISGLVLNQMPFNRERDPRQSTEFAFTRFLVPHLSGYRGYSLFMDCDMLCRADIVDLFALIDTDKAVSVVKHDYTPKTERKFLGQVQTVYPKKNWSSVMLFNNARCQMLSPDYVEKASGLDLHQFKWVSEDRVGELPAEWNHLVGEYEPNPDAKIVHYTLGGPYFPEYERCEFAEEWFAELDRMTYSNKKVTEAV